MAKRGTWLIWLAWLPPVTVAAIAVAAVIVLAIRGYRADERPASGVRPEPTITNLDAREDLLRRSYFVCLDNLAEDTCLDRFGRLLWYPRDAAECEGIGARVENVVTLGGEPRWRDLFKSERCARLDLPYSDKAVNAGKRAGPDGPYAKCDQGFADREYCDEESSNHLWFPHEDGEDRCGHAAYALGWEMNNFWEKPPPEKFTGPEWAKRKPPRWMWVFKNERCWRLGKEFHVPRLPR